MEEGLNPHNHCSYCGRYLSIGIYSGSRICLNCTDVEFTEKEKEKYFGLVIKKGNRN